MPSPLLSIEHLRVDFAEMVAVQDLTLELEKGDVCGLIGPNGAGKTTTMRAICGLQEFTRGIIKVGETDLSDSPLELKRRLGFMPDFCPVYDQLTTREFLEHYARAYQVPDRSRRVEECLEITWLQDKGDALCEGLSRGMKQRLVLAKTLLPNPEALLLDEPASGLDPLGRIELMKILLQLREAGKTVLISSHILTELSGFCNKAAIMEKGSLVAFGTIEELSRKLTRRRLSVRWRKEHPSAWEILKTTPGVGGLSPGGESAVFEFTQDSAALDELLRQLVLNGVRLTEWRTLDDDLEQIFLESGARELQ